jgi:hypothetical protein
MDVELPDGKIVRGVPDGTTKAQLTEKLAKNGISFSSLPAAPAEEKVGAGRTLMDQTLQGATFGWSDEVSDALGALGARAYTGYKNTAPEFMGGEPGKYAGDTLAGEYREARGQSQDRLSREEKQHPTLSTVGQIGGAILGPGAGGAKMLGKVIPDAIKGSKAASRVAKGIAGGTAGGAAYGAGSAKEGERTEGAIKGAEAGAITGGAVSGGLEAVTKAAAPVFQKSVELLRREGVRLTPGQLAGGVVKTGESAATSVPVLGGVIRGGQQNSIDSFNEAVWNRALKPLGMKLPSHISPGPESVKYVGDAIGKKYDALMPKLSLTLDGQAVKDFKAIDDSTVSRLTEPMKKQFESLMDNIMRPRMDGALRMAGEDFKRVDSELSYEARQYLKSQNPEHVGLGQALTEARAVLRNTLERTNPAHEKELRELNSAWAIYKRAEGASVRRLSSGGVFMPSDLLADIKKNTSSGIFARGDAQLQDLAAAGQHVLPHDVPNSGTMDRSLWATLLAGGAHFNPVTVAGAAAASLPYTKPGMAAMNAFATGPRRAAARKAIEKVEPAIAAGAGTAAGAQPQEETAP